MDKKFIVATKSEENENERSIVGWASKPTIDRDKELILANAWQLDNFRKNPVVMLAHDYHSLPIGKCLWIKSTDLGLKFKCKFANTERGKEVYGLYEQGFLNCFSVGFKARPGGVIDNPPDIKYKGVKRLFTDVELMEISCVPIPANQDSLVDQSSFVKYIKEGHIMTKGLKDELEAIIEIIEKDDDKLELEIKTTEELEVKAEDTIVETEEEIVTKASCKPEADEVEKDFLARCMSDASMSKLPENLRTNSCKLIWDKANAKEPEIESIEIKAVTPNADEAEKDFMERCMGDASMSKLNEGFRANACKLAWKKSTAEAKKEPESTEVIIKQESVEDFLLRTLPESKMVIKTAEELAQVLEKSLLVDELQETVKAMEAQAVPDLQDRVIKTLDSQGNPSVYDLMSSLDRALNPMRNEFNPVINQTDINKNVVDIFAVNFPSGNLVYSEMDRATKTTKYYQAGYIYDLKMRVATIIGTPEEVLQSWVADRYFIEAKSEDENEVITKAGRTISAKNQALIQECIDKMDEAQSALESLIETEDETEEPEDETPVDDMEEKELEQELVDIEFEMEKKADDQIEFEEIEDNLIEVDDAMIKSAVNAMIAKSGPAINVKEIAETVVAKLKGRVTL
jgi:HK97 family phage prohead protease